MTNGPSALAPTAAAFACAILFVGVLTGIASCNSDSSDMRYHHASGGVIGGTNSPERAALSLLGPKSSLCTILLSGGGAEHLMRAWNAWTDGGLMQFCESDAG